MKFDINNDGHISIDELLCLTRGLGMDDSKEQLKEMMKKMDKNNDNHIDFPEFLALMYEKEKEKKDEKEI